MTGTPQLYHIDWNGCEHIQIPGHHPKNRIKRNSKGHHSDRKNLQSVPSHCFTAGNSNSKFSAMKLIPWDIFLKNKIFLYRTEICSLTVNSNLSSGSNLFPLGLLPTLPNQILSLQCILLWDGLQTPEPGKPTLFSLVQALAGSVIMYGSKKSLQYHVYKSIYQTLEKLST